MTLSLLLTGMTSCWLLHRTQTNTVTKFTPYLA